MRKPDLTVSQAQEAVHEPPINGSGDEPGDYEAEDALKDPKQSSVALTKEKLLFERCGPEPVLVGGEVTPVKVGTALATDVAP